MLQWLAAGAYPHLLLLTDKAFRRQPLALGPKHRQVLGTAMELELTAGKAFGFSVELARVQLLVKFCWGKGA